MTKRERQAAEYVAELIEDLAGPGWRILKEDEMPQAGDQCRFRREFEGDRWSNSAAGVFGNRQDPECWYRRRISNVGVDGGGTPDSRTTGEGTPAGR